jgi:two-component system CheB/CheR fusion protein
LRVRRFTPQTAKLIKLLPVDIGRPVTDIVSDLDYPHLAEDAREVLRTLVCVERQVPARGGHWCMVRLMPYCTQDRRIDGVVITFVDIGLAKTLEAALREVVAAVRSRTVNPTSASAGPSVLDKALQKAQAVLEAGASPSTNGLRLGLGGSPAPKKAPS